MQARALAIAGCWYVAGERHADARGWFSEALNLSALSDAIGRQMAVAQINLSSSNVGVIRGIHYSVAEDGQAKYVQCLQGRVLDVIVDLREGSPTFGEYGSVFLSSEEPGSVFIAEGVGHAFAVVEGPAQVMYATSSPYEPAAEFVLNPLDPELAIPWPTGVPHILSNRDRTAPRLSDLARDGLLPKRWNRESYGTV